MSSMRIWPLIEAFASAVACSRRAPENPIDNKVSVASDRPREVHEDTQPSRTKNFTAVGAGWSWTQSRLRYFLQRIQSLRKGLTSVRSSPSARFQPRPRLNTSVLGFGLRWFAASIDHGRKRAYRY